MPIKKELLKKMSMPKGKAEEPMFDVSDEEVSAELGDEVPEGSIEEEASETPAEEGQELVNVADDVLQAEMEKRGFKVVAPKKKPEEASADSTDELEGEPVSDEEAY